MLADRRANGLNIILTHGLSTKGRHKKEPFEWKGP